MKKNTLIILGHPDANSYSGSLAETYLEHAQTEGRNIKFVKLGDLSFDPILRHGYRERQELEPDLKALLEDIQWAEHLVFVYPIWWGSMPALLKGFFDRAFLPGIVYNHRENSVWWDRLLTGKSAQLIVTMDTPPWYFRLVYRMPGHNQMKRTILKWCGVNPVKIASFGPIRGATDKQLTKWRHKVAKLAKQS